MNPSNPIRGFTLIELMIVIVVLAVLATIAAPNMADFVDKRRTSAAAEEVFGLIQTARSEAIKQSGDMRLMIFPGGAGGWAVGLIDEALIPPPTLDPNDPPNPDADACTSFVHRAGCRIRSGDTTVTKLVDSQPGSFPGVGIVLETGTATQVFTPRGVTAGTTESELVVTSGRGWQLRVDVNVLGRTRICAPNAAKNPGAYRPCAL